MGWANTNYNKQKKRVLNEQMQKNKKLNFTAPAICLALCRNDNSVKQK